MQNTTSSDPLYAKIVGYAVAGVGAVVTLALIMILSFIVRGWALTILWEWFVEPVFMVTPLSLPLAIGLFLVVGLFTTGLATKDDNEDDISTKLGKSLARIVFFPLVAVGIGWLVTLFM